MIIGEYRMKKTKIIATIGPNSYSKEMLQQLVMNGMDVVRLNLSHADYEFCERVMDTIGEINDEMHTNIAVMLDTKGPDIRTHRFAGGHAFLTKNDKIRIYMDEIVGDSTKFSVTYKNLIDDVGIGGILKLNDGLITLKVISKGSNYLVCEVLVEGMISDFKSVNAPGITFDRPFLSEKDKEDIAFASRHHVDFLALSFVSSKEDVLEVNDLLISAGNDHTSIISKIESETGVQCMNEIISVSDGIMIARGDLGVELPLEQVPIIQKQIIKRCHEMEKISIVATEMLSSMENVSRPTRAEVNDVATAVFDRVDAVMLSAETTIGKYPLESVTMMRKILEATEEHVDYLSFFEKVSKLEEKDITGTIAYNVAESAIRMHCSAIIAPTISGYTARKMSRYRPSCPIIAVSPNELTIRSLALHFGVIGVLTDELHSLDKIIDESTSCAKKILHLVPGEKIVIAGGHPFHATNHTNFMKIEELE